MIISFARIRDGSFYFHWFISFHYFFEIVSVEDTQQFLISLSERQLANLVHLAHLARKLFFLPHRL